MKNFILKRERILHVLSLLAIVVSVFLHNIELKFAVLVLGIIGLVGIAAAKRNKVTLIIYILLLIVAFVGYFLVQNGKLSIPQT